MLRVLNSAKTNFTYAIFLASKMHSFRTFFDLYYVESKVMYEREVVFSRHANILCVCHSWECVCLYGGPAQLGVIIQCAGHCLLSNCAL